MPPTATATADEHELARHDDDGGSGAEPDSAPVELALYFGQPQGDARSINVLVAPPDRQRFVKSLTEAAAQVHRTLQATRDTFFSDGPGAKLNEVDARIADFRRRADQARTRSDLANSQWRRAVLDSNDGDVDELQRADREADAESRDLTARAELLGAELDRLRSQCREQLRAELLTALRSGHAAASAEAERVKAAALAKMAELIADPFAAAVLALARAGGFAAAGNRDIDRVLAGDFRADTTT